MGKKEKAEFVGGSPRRVNRKLLPNEDDRDPEHWKTRKEELERESEDAKRSKPAGTTRKLRICILYQLFRSHLHEVAGDICLI